MPDNRENTEAAGPKTTGAPRPLIEQALVDLHIARRTLLIYPAAHDQVKRGLSRVFQSLSNVLAEDKIITLAVFKEGITTNDRAMESNPAVFADLASVLKHYQIATLTFFNGLEPNELVHFLRLITADREKIITQGGIAAVAGRYRLPHIQIQTVDFSKLQLTEESEIQRSSRRDNGGSIWQAFVANLLSGDDQRHPGGNAESGINLDPNELADMLNRQVLNPGAAITYYERLVAGAAAGEPGLQQISAGLVQFQQMIKELNPDLQKQFLATTFDRCAQTENVSNTAHLIDGLGGELILQMLRQASSTGKQISPSLVAFINKIGHLGVLPDDSPVVGDDPAGDAEGISSQKIESLLAHEQYNTYVDADYDRVLGVLTRRERDADMGSASSGLVQTLAVELSDAGISAHVGRAMTRLMTTSADVAGYRDWARQLAYLLDDLLDSRAFGYLIELMKFARTEEAGDDKERSEIAGLLLSRFSDPQFVAKAIGSIQKSGGDLSADALGFLVELGEPVVLEIFDDLDPSHTLHDEGVLTQILRNLSTITSQEALERLKDPRPDYVCRMLRIIRKLGNREIAQHARSLLDHGDQGVRMEALGTLLKFDNSWGVIRLRELLQQPLGADFMPALELAAEYRIRTVVPQLLVYFEQSRDLKLREAALRALGRIGDSKVIPALAKFAHRRWSLSKKQTAHLKRVLFDTLKGYPFGEIKHLLHFGLKQKDGAIQSVCQKLLRQGTKGGAGVQNEI